MSTPKFLELLNKNLVRTHQEADLESWSQAIIRQPRSTCRHGANLGRKLESPWSREAFLDKKTFQTRLFYFQLEFEK